MAVAYRAGPLARWSRAYRSALERAAARGEIDASLPGSLAAECGPGVLLQCWLVRGEPITAVLVTRTVDEVLLPLLLSRGAAGRA